MTSDPAETRAHAAVGHFIARCSMLEHIAHGSLKSLLGLNAELSRLLVGSPRIGDLLDLLLKVARLKKMSAPRLEALAIMVLAARRSNLIRQIVAHKPLWVNIDGELVFLNRSPRSGDTGTALRCTVEQLDNLTHLVYFLARNIMWVCGPGRRPTARVNVIAERLALLENTPLPTIPGTTDPAKIPKRQRQRPASPG